MATATILAGVVALVHCPSDAGTREALTAKLERIGARVVQRLNKEVTHVVHKGKLALSGPDKIEQDSELWSLHDKVDKMELPPVVVGVSWIERSVQEKRRALEREFLVRRPADPMLNKLVASNTPGSASGKKRVRRAAGAAPPPRAKENYQVDAGDLMFSSSQQINEAKAQPHHQPAINDARAAHDIISPPAAKRARVDRSIADGNRRRTPGSVKRTPRARAGAVAAPRVSAVASASKAVTASASKAPGAEARTCSLLTAAPHSEPPAWRPSGLGAGLTAAPRGGSGGGAAVQQLLRQPTRFGSTLGPSAAGQGGKGDRAVHQASTAGRRQQHEQDDEEDQQAAARGSRSAAPRQAGVQAAFSSGPLVGGPLRRSREDGARTSARVAADDGVDEIVEDSDCEEDGWAAPVAAAAAAVQQRQPAAAGTLEAAAANSARVAGDSAGPSGREEPRQQQRGGPPHGQAQQRQKLCGGNSGTAAGDRSSGACNGGVLGLTSVEPEIAEMARAGVRRLRGMRLCTDGNEACTTHLIVGKGRRTLKVLLAIANGSWLLTPEWLSASLEAGHWVGEEEKYEVQGVWSAAAARARAAKAAAATAAPPGKGGITSPAGHAGRAGQERQRQLLHGHQVCITAAGDDKEGAANVAPLRRLVVALAGKVVGARACTLCVMCGQRASRPPGLQPHVPLVREEWLLNSAAQYALLDQEEFRVGSAVLKNGC